MHVHSFIHPSPNSSSVSLISFLLSPPNQAKYLERFRAPFDWTTTNVFYLTRLTKLTHLTLDHYQTFRQLPPWKINTLMRSLPSLQVLKISYVSPSFAVSGFLKWLLVIPTGVYNWVWKIGELPLSFRSSNTTITLITPFKTTLTCLNMIYSSLISSLPPYLSL